WMRAYQEINEFEASLDKWGAVIIKFWLQIDRDEQLRRFNEREDTFSKKYKITDEDWRNRDKWDEYELAVSDMIRYTSTDFAPWNLIEANSKRHARIKTMEIFIDKIEERLKKED
ncbi:MAG: phosphate--AMP phosphotransferase, partial [Proteocatella sp.]|nr:phosphate--AMP phosphotransferase [Proteocatella sp.]